MDNMTIDDIGFQQRVLQRMMELTQQKEEHLKQKMEYEGPGYEFDLFRRWCGANRRMCNTRSPYLPTS